MGGPHPGDEARAGTELGGYRIEAAIGAGGMGVVYRATDLGTGREVALKLLRAGLANDEERRRRFLREARLAATLDHPGVVRTHEVGDVQGIVFIAMELVAGQSLKAWIAAERARVEHVDPARVLVVARAIASAVCYAHEKGIIHRDLKPDNVMVQDDLSVRILDFGLAKLREIEGGALYEAETETNLTRDGGVLGTPGYMAPEQASGKEVSFAADVFAMGAILYEMLSGARAFDGDSPVDVIVAVTRDEPPPLRTKNPRVGSALEALVTSCLAKAPAERPTMAALATALARPSLLDGRTTRRRSLVLGSALLAVVLAALGSLVAASRPLGRSAYAAAEASVPDAAPVPTAVTDLPMPASTVPAALAAYRKAITDERDGAEDAAIDELSAATELDPMLAAAHLRLAQARATVEALSARSHFAQAVKYRDRLSPRDLEVLEADRPLFQSDPPDLEGWARRFEELVARRPGDAELHYILHSVHDNLGDFARAEEDAKRALAIDPRFGLAWAATAEVQAYRGEFEASLSSVKRCLEVSPTASWCIWVEEFIDGDEGRCANNEADAHRRIAIDPNVSDSYKALAFSLMALGRPEALVREAIEQTVLRIPDAFGKLRFGLNMRSRLAVVRGDFVEAAKLLQELRTAVQSRTDAADHGAVLLLSAEVERESGRPDRAAVFARSFLDRHDAWLGGPIVHDYSLASDLTPLMLDFVKNDRTGPAVDTRAVLETWRKQYEVGLRGSYRPYLWVYGYAAPATTVEEARLAVEALPRYAPIPPFLPNGALPRVSIGRALWLAGRDDEGIRYLREAAAQCAMGVRPMQSILAHAWLAEALEKKGDTKGACAELDIVLGHWGNAKPRSVTADWARARSRALACAQAAR